MAKDRYWFDHDYTSRNDDKILELRAAYGAEGYGIFWMIVETMAENENGGVKATLIGGLSLGYGVAKDRLLAIVQFCIGVNLFYEKEGYYFSKRMLDHKTKRRKMSEGGKEGAEKRWGTDLPPNSPPNSPPIAPLMQRREEERKREKRREEESKSAAEGVIIFDIEKYLLENEKEFEAVCMTHPRKTTEEVKEILQKYHLWMMREEKYPKPPLALIAGLKAWILNEKPKKNGQHNPSTVGKTLERDKL